MLVQISMWVTCTSLQKKKRDAHSTYYSHPRRRTKRQTTRPLTPPPSHCIHTGSKLRSLPTPPLYYTLPVSRDPRRDPFALTGPCAAAGCPASPAKEGSSFSSKAAEEPPSPRRASRTPAGFHRQQKRRRRFWGELRDGFGSATIPMKNWHRTVRVAIAYA